LYLMRRRVALPCQLVLRIVFPRCHGWLARAALGAERSPQNVYHSESAFSAASARFTPVPDPPNAVDG
jgi:hypothetical protein